MALVNSQLLKISHDGVQDMIARRVSRFKAMNPRSKIIELSRGDVVRPLSPVVVDAMNSSLQELASDPTMQGRGPVEGYKFLIDAIVKGDFRSRKIKIDASEIFINEGTKSELAAIGDILCNDNRIAVPSVVYQTFVDSNVMAARAGELGDEGEWSHLIYMDSPPEKNFSPQMPSVERADVIYICNPNDPTGCAMSRKELEKVVDFAIKNQILILYDATYEAFITDKSLPHSIYEIKGAKRCAIELRSFSKSAGFTSLHCGYTVIPKELDGYSFSADCCASLNELWRRRQEIKNYAPSYIVQRGAEALYSAEGQQYIKQSVDYYMRNARLLREALASTRLRFWGGENAPFIWVESPFESAWPLFDHLLHKCNIVCSPGERFGAAAAGYIRLSAMADHTQVLMASNHLSELDL